MTPQQFVDLHPDYNTDLADPTILSYNTHLLYNVKPAEFAGSLDHDAIDKTLGTIWVFMKGADPVAWYDTETVRGWKA